MDVGLAQHKIQQKSFSITEKNAYEIISCAFYLENEATSLFEIKCFH